MLARLRSREPTWAAEPWRVRWTTLRRPNAGGHTSSYEFHIIGGTAWTRIPGQLRALTPGPENATPNGANEKFAAFLLHSAENGDSKGAGRAAGGPKISRESTEWAQRGLNLRPLPCE